MKKKEYYSKKEVVSTYLKWRYGGKSGEYVNKKELDSIHKLLPKNGKVLDAACGLGRFKIIFDRNNLKITGVDYSSEMLKNCVYSNKIKSDLSKLPFKDNSFDCVVCSRFFFHYPKIDRFLKELTRVTKKSGVIIFDTHKWSPLMFKSPLTKPLGGKSYIHTDKKLNKLFKQLKLKVEEKESVFLFSPFIYRYLPLFLIKILDFIENPLKRICMVDYWKLRKIN